MSPVELSIFIVFGFSLLVQLVFYWLIFSRLAFYKSTKETQKELPPVSIVIAARNEYHHLIKHLPLILEQDYPAFEVIVVNHASDDETKIYLDDLGRREPKLKPVHIDRDLNFFSGKKFPLSIGIKSAKNEILLLTDADCVPQGKNWIRSVVENYGADTEIVIGFGPYMKQKGFLNLIVRYDTFMIAMQYLSFALSGMPYMGVGRNLSYKRSTFFRNKGFTSHYKIASGDDDLFINQAANKSNTRIALNPESFMYSPAKQNFSTWFRQKQRHLSTGTQYKSKFKFLLGMFGITQFLFYLSLIVLLVLWVQPLILLGAFVVRLASQILVHKKVLDRLRDHQILLFSLFWELFHVVIIQTITLFSIFRKPVQWK